MTDPRPPTPDPAKPDELRDDAALLVENARLREALRCAADPMSEPWRHLRETMKVLLMDVAENRLSDAEVRVRELLVLLSGAPTLIAALAARAPAAAQGAGDFAGVVEAANLIRGHLFYCVHCDAMATCFGGSDRGRIVAYCDLHCSHKDGDYGKDSWCRPFANLSPAAAPAQAPAAMPRPDLKEMLHAKMAAMTPADKAAFLQRLDALCEEEAAADAAASDSPAFSRPCDPSIPCGRKDCPHCSGYALPEEIEACPASSREEEKP